MVSQGIPSKSLHMVSVNAINILSTAPKVADQFGRWRGTRCTD